MPHISGFVELVPGNYREPRERRLLLHTIGSLPPLDVRQKHMVKLRKDERNLAPNFRGCFTFSYPNGHMVLFAWAELNKELARVRAERHVLHPKLAVGKHCQQVVLLKCVSRTRWVSLHVTLACVYSERAQKGDRGFEVEDYRGIHQKTCCWSLNTEQDLYNITQFFFFALPESYDNNISKIMLKCCWRSESKPPCLNSDYPYSV